MKKKKFALIRGILIIMFLCLPFVVYVYSTKKTETATVTVKELFHDNLACTLFNDEKTENFEIVESSTVEFEYDSDISSGELYVEIREEEGNIIFNNADEMNGKKTFTLTLSPGNYVYYLNGKDVKGMI